MSYILNKNTEILYNGNSKPIKNAVNILKRDINKCFCGSALEKTVIMLNVESSLERERFSINVGNTLDIYASDELGFVYGLLYISEKFLGIRPFWFWMDQLIPKRESVEIKEGVYTSRPPIIKYRGWFVNDEVLIMKWQINGDKTEPWRMVFEALLRCGGNMVIPGTDKNSKTYRQLASDMGLWITHHHAEPLGAEMFSRAYPNIEPNYAEHPEMFQRLWEDAAKEQKDMKVIWCLGFRGQGDCPFWKSDTSGRFDTSEKRGALISEVIECQRKIILKYAPDAIFCTNIYGEITELYDEGHIKLSDDIIKISADNGYGKMVTRRLGNHNTRISSIPKSLPKHGGIYYHVSFYDLQAANHITMLPNSIEFVNRELNSVTENNMTDYWLINCSNVRPHTYFLDALRRKWFGEEIDDDIQSRNFVGDYFNGNEEIAALYRDYHNAMLSYGQEDDEHAGEQFFTENVRLIVHSVFNGRDEGTPGLNWLTGKRPLKEQVSEFKNICKKGMAKTENFYCICKKLSGTLSGDLKLLFDATVMLQAAIYYYCVKGTVTFAQGCEKYFAGDKLGAFITVGDSAVLFYKADEIMRASEYGVWKGFYFNDCFADVKFTGYMAEKLMGFIRERGDNAHHDRWYREAIYAPENKNIFTLLVDDNHMKDWELYKAFKEKEQANHSL